jgi:carbon-monoxide dehydrogenase small subunit
MSTSKRTIALTANGRPAEASVEPRLLLADLLRDDLGLRSVHLGCEHGSCGACTVLMDGAPVRSCLTLAVQADGADITTVESLAERGELHPLQESFRRHHALQCGFCTSGFLMTTLHLLDAQPDLEDEQDVRQALSGNLCRCTGYQNIVDAVIDYAKQQRAAQVTE